MALKIAVNGFGRIGRCLARLSAIRDDIEIVAINDVSPPQMTKYLLENDSVHSNAGFDVEILDGYMSFANMKVKMFSSRDINELDFADFGADVLIESTGKFLTTKDNEVHIKKGIKKVILSAPAKDDTPTYVLGVNDSSYGGEDIVSNASCTTNCLAPIAKVLDDNFTIEKGLMTTVHSYTNDQNILDVKHKDKRRSRAAALNIIPTSTGAAKAIGLVMPNLQGRLHGQSVRVPTPNVSMVDLNCVVSKSTTKDEVNEVLKSFANSTLKGILKIDDDFRVSSDFIGDSASSIVASDLTQVIQTDLIKVMSWYDNEWGYSSRLLDMAIKISK